MFCRDFPPQRKSVVRARARLVQLFLLEGPGIQIFLPPITAAGSRRAPWHSRVSAAVPFDARATEPDIICWDDIAMRSQDPPRRMYRLCEIVHRAASGRWRHPD